MNENRPIIFLVKNRALGDSVMGLASVTYFRSLYPKATIIYAVPQWTAALYQNVKTDADYIYPLKMKSLSDILDLYTDLIDLKVDLIHEMHQSGTGRKVFTVFSALKNIPYTFHNHHLIGKSKVVDQGEKKELIQRDLDGIYSFYGQSKARPNYLNFEPKLELFTKQNRKKRVILGVVATRESKKWPIVNFYNLAKRIKEFDSSYEIVAPLSQSADDAILIEALKKTCAKTQPEINIVQMPLSDLPQYFFESEIYIGNDTGLKHLAVATKMKSITMFGPEPIREWHPYNLNNHIAEYISELSCRTRHAHYCGLAICDLVTDENMQCMKKISVDLVFEKFKILCRS